MKVPYNPLTILRDHLFKTSDSFLPDNIRAFPYQKALQSLYTLLPNEVEVWTRNSFYKGNFVFGVSDLDVTLYFKNFDISLLRKVKVIIADHRKLFPFLGEVNFYWSDIASDFIPSINYFERVRDPLLSNKLPSLDHDLKVEKIVFLLRMLYSDRIKLKHFPGLRQKKWKEHFRELGMDVPDFISKEVLDTAIIELVNSKNAELALKLLEEQQLNENLLFNNNVPDSWKFLFPHLYLWFDRGRLEDFSGAKEEIFAKVCLRQVDWEIWGLMTQLPYLKHNSAGLLTHLGRMKRLGELLDASGKTAERVDQLLKISQRF